MGRWSLGLTMDSKFALCTIALFWVRADCNWGFGTAQEGECGTLNEESPGAEALVTRLSGWLAGVHLHDGGRRRSTFSQGRHQNVCPVSRSLWSVTTTP